MTSIDNASLYTLGDRGQTVDGAANDVRGREVKDKDGTGIGKVADLLIDDQDDKVRFLLVEHGGFLGFGQTKTLIPVDAVTNVTEDHVDIDQSRDHVAQAPGYDPDLVVDRPYYASIYSHYGFAPYWGLGYMYPSAGAFFPTSGPMARVELARGPGAPEPRHDCAVTGAAESVGLPAATRACLFDLDGVLTDTAKVHAAAWKEMFDGYLTAWAEETGAILVAFDEVADYDTYVDGKSRSDGTRSFLESRGIDLPTDGLGDAPDGATITGLGDAKNAILLRRIRSDGVVPYPGSLRYVRAVRAAGLRTAVVSSSANCAEVLDAAGIADLFEARIDGLSVEKQQLAGKPAPDTFLAAASLLGVEPSDAAVFEDALSGVAAGRAGGFGFVVGVDRAGQANELRAHGADRVVTDLADLIEGGESA